MGFNDKFLNVCFKSGKILFSFLLIVALITSLVFLCQSGYKAVKASQVKMTYDYKIADAFKTLYGDILPVSNSDDSDKSLKKEETKNYKQSRQIIVDFLKEEGLPEDALNSFSHPDDDSQLIPYAKGFITYYKNFVSVFQTLLETKTDMSQKQAENVVKANKLNLYQDAVKAYSSEFNKELEEINILKQQKIFERNTSFIAFLISLGVFVLFLFLPILIRIEENTRK